MSEHFDVAVLGMGPGGEVAASRLIKAGKKVAVFERELIGGECAYWACIPSKTVLRPAEEALATMTGWIERHRRRAEERMSRLEEVLADLPSSDHGSTSNRSRPMSTTPSTTDHITTATIEADPEVPVVRITRDFTATAEQLHRGHTSGMEIGINEGYAALDAGEVA